MTQTTISAPGVWVLNSGKMHRSLTRGMRIRISGEKDEYTVESVAGQSAKLAGSGYLGGCQISTGAEVEILLARPEKTNNGLTVDTSPSRDISSSLRYNAQPKRPSAQRTERTSTQEEKVMASRRGTSRNSAPSAATQETLDTMAQEDGEDQMSDQDQQNAGQGQDQPANTAPDTSIPDALGQEDTALSGPVDASNFASVSPTGNEDEPPAIDVSTEDGSAQGGNGESEDPVVIGRAPTALSYPTSNDGETYTLGAMAELVGVSKPTINRYAMMNRDLLSSHTTGEGRKVRYLASAVDVFRSIKERSGNTGGGGSARVTGTAGGTSRAKGNKAATAGSRSSKTSAPPAPVSLDEMVAQLQRGVMDVGRNAKIEALESLVADIQAQIDLLRREG